MGVRPPANDDEEPEAIEFGIAAVDARLDDADVTFPASKRDIVDALNRSEVPYDATGRSVSLDDAIGETGRQEFDSEQDLLNALHPVFEKRRSSPAGIIDSVKALLPF
jgi:hypothetical protein